MVKKVSFKFMTIMSQFRGITVGDGMPGCNAPMSSITAFICCKSCSNLHLPFFFLITNTGVFHGLVVGTMFPCCSCSLTSVHRALAFSDDKGR